MKISTKCLPFKKAVKFGKDRNRQWFFQGLVAGRDRQWRMIVARHGDFYFALSGLVKFLFRSIKWAR